MANNGNEGRTATEPEPILTIAPFFFFNIAGSTALVTQVAASEFTLIRLSVIFQSTSWKNRALGYETPALFIRTPTSNSLILPSIAFDISGPLNVAKSATTFFMSTCWSPNLARISFDVASSFEGFRPTRTRLRPFDASSKARALPIPSVEPVIIAQEPYSFKFFGGLKNMSHIHLRKQKICLQRETKPRQLTATRKTACNSISITCGRWNCSRYMSARMCILLYNTLNGGGSLFPHT